MNSLPKLIDDKKVRIKEVREFLGKEFPKDSLPTVDEARALAAGHRAAMELFRKNEERAGAGGPARRSAARSCSANSRPPPPGCGAGERRRWPTGSGRPGQEFATRQKEERAAFRQGYLQESRRIRLDRAAHRPTRACRLHRPHYRRRADNEEDSAVPRHDPVHAFLAQKEELAERQQREAAALDAPAGARNLDHAAPLARAGTGRAARAAVTGNGAAEGAPDRGAGADGPRAAARRAVPRPHTDEFNKAAKKPIDLTAEFERAAGSGEGEGEASGVRLRTRRPRPRSRSSGGSGRGIGRRTLNARLRRGALTAIGIMMVRPATIRPRAGVGTGISIAAGNWHFFPFFLNCPYNWPRQGNSIVGSPPTGF